MVSDGILPQDLAHYRCHPSSLQHSSFSVSSSIPKQLQKQTGQANLIFNVHNYATACVRACARVSVHQCFVSILWFYDMTFPWMPCIHTTTHTQMRHSLTCNSASCICAQSMHASRISPKPVATTASRARMHGTIMAARGGSVVGWWSAAEGSKLVPVGRNWISNNIHCAHACIWMNT